MANTSPKKKYITKRILKSATNRAFKSASKEAFDVSESVVEVRNGWVVRRYKSGELQKIKKLPIVNKDQIALD